MKAFLSWLASLISLILLPHSAIAQSSPVPNLVNFQGNLVGSDGVPLETKEYEISFEIFGSKTGNDSLWGPQIFDGRTLEGHGETVSVVRGHFNVVLGPWDVRQRRIEQAFASGQTYLEIVLEKQEPLTPRRQILSAPYALRSGFPPGTIIAFGGKAEKIPNGWLLCDGSTRLITDYAALYEIIGHLWEGNNPADSTTFRLPDLRGTFLRGLDMAGSVDPDGASRNVGSQQDWMLAHHGHVMSALSIENGDNTRGSVRRPRSTIAEEDQSPGGPRFGTLTDARNGNNEIISGPEVRPVNAAVNFIIKY